MGNATYALGVLNGVYVLVTCDSIGGIRVFVSDIEAGVQEILLPNMDTLRMHLRGEDLVDAPPIAATMDIETLDVQRSPVSIDKLLEALLPGLEVLDIKMEECYLQLPAEVVLQALANPMLARRSADIPAPIRENMHNHMPLLTELSKLMEQ